jgi:hypothetical protein
MTGQTIATRSKPEGKLAFHVERRPHFLLVAIKGEGGFDHAEVISAEAMLGRPFGPPLRGPG